MPMNRSPPAGTGDITAPTPPDAGDDILRPLSNDEVAEVVFLGSVRKQAPSSPSPSHLIKAGSRPFRRGEPHRPKRARTGSKRPTAKALRNLTIPPSIRNTRVKLGYLLDTKTSVYGFFDNAGKFRREADVETERASDPGPSTRSVPVSSKEVAYRSEYQGLSYRQLQQAVCHRLLADDSHGQV
jgi:hypothetical protein